MKKRVLLLCLAAASSVGVAAENDNPTARQILQQMATVYATCKSYEDTGVLGKTFDAPSFRTHFKRPGLFRFDFMRQFVPGSQKDQYVVWSDSKQSHVYWQTFGSYWPEKSLESSINSMTGITLGAGRTVPRLLLDLSSGFSPTHLEHVALLRTEQFDGQNCYVISGDYSQATRQCQLWIGTDDCLLRKMKVEYQSCVTEEIHRNISIDKSIADDAFKFTPPEGTKLIGSVFDVLPEVEHQLAEAQAKAMAKIAEARQRQLQQTKIYWVDCRPEGVTISPGGDQISLEGLGRTNNPLTKVLDVAAVNPHFDRIFVQIHRDSIATYRAVRRVADSRPVLVQYEPAEENNGPGANSNPKVRRIVITSSMKERPQVPVNLRRLYVKCRDGQVYLVDWDGAGGMQVLGSDELDRPGGKFAMLLMHLNKQTHYIRFFVADDSFSVFGKARDVAERRGFLTSWELFGVNEPILIGKDQNP